MSVMGSSPEWTVLPYVGLTILLWEGGYQKVTEKPSPQVVQTRQALTDNGC